MGDPDLLKDHETDSWVDISVHDNYNFLEKEKNFNGVSGRQDMMGLGSWI